MEPITKFSNKLKTQKVHGILCINHEQERTFFGLHLQHHQKYEVPGVNLTQERKDLARENHKEDTEEGLNK